MLYTYSRVPMGQKRMKKPFLKVPPLQFLVPSPISFWRTWHGWSSRSEIICFFLSAGLVQTACECVICSNQQKTLPNCNPLQQLPSFSASFKQNFSKDNSHSLLQFSYPTVTFFPFYCQYNMYRTTWGVTRILVCRSLCLRTHPWKLLTPQHWSVFPSLPEPTVQPWLGNCKPEFLLCMGNMGKYLHHFIMKMFKRTAK